MDEGLKGFMTQALGKVNIHPLFNVAIVIDVDSSVDYVPLLFSSLSLSPVSFTCHIKTVPI